MRMDSHVYPDYVVPPSYDSLLGKVSSSCVSDVPNRRFSTSIIDRVSDLVSCLSMFVNVHQYNILFDVILRSLFVNIVCFSLLCGHQQGKGQSSA